MIGTLTGARTTPESSELQALLASMVVEGKQAVAMEVSSHALAQHRVDATRFAVAVFTNLSRDHLDFHASMEEYFEVKARLFEPDRSSVGVVNVDDPHGRLLVEAARIPMHPFSLDDAVDLEVGAASSTFRWQGEAVRLPLGGRFNVSNALAAATAARLLDVPAATIAAGLSSAAPVAGRFEPVDAGQPFRVVVDYAHTPDGLEQLLAAAREVAGSGRVIVVFGAGGDRDRTKRPAMGAIAARLADRVVVTSDNPRSEEPRAIIDEIVAGAGDRTRIVVEPDRRVAIDLALDGAAAGDVVVVAGKGHETTQTIGARVLEFDDRVVVREGLERLRRAGAGW
jgi:UDP-N-acetylmuramoyl-L-alanyl-D-glutamate--2,6-diaminopimelate ligase